MNTLIPLKEFAATKQSCIVAHRGSSGTAPENTMSAMRHALDANATMIELDVQLTADNYPIVFHDAILGRTTNGHGHVSNTDYTTLQTLDAGSWFGVDFENERIPLLDDILMLLRGKAYVNIEIKSSSDVKGYVGRIEQILSSVLSANMMEYTLFSSFDHSMLLHLKQRYSTAHTAAIHNPQQKLLPSQVATEIGCEAYVCSLKECTHRRADDAMNAGLYMGVYTINTRADVEHILGYPVQAYITNYPDLVKTYRQELGYLIP